jgi:hypothetical protein
MKADICPWARLSWNQAGLLGSVKIDCRKEKFQEGHEMRKQHVTFVLWSEAVQGAWGL